MKQKFLSHWILGNEGKWSFKMGNKQDEPSYNCSSLLTWEEV